MSYEEDLQAIQDGIDAGCITPEQAADLYKIMAKKQAAERAREIDLNLKSEQRNCSHN